MRTNRLSASPYRQQGISAEYKSSLGTAVEILDRLGLGDWGGKDKLDFLLRVLKRIVARIPLEACSPRWKHAHPIAIGPYVLEDALLGLVPRPMAPPFHRFPFRRLEERLGRRVVRRRAGP